MTDIYAAATLLDSRMRNNADVMTSDLKTRGISTLRTSKNDDIMCAELNKMKMMIKILARNHHRRDELLMRRVHSAYTEKLQSD